MKAIYIPVLFIFVWGAAMPQHTMPTHRELLETLNSSQSKEEVSEAYRALISDFVYTNLDSALIVIEQIESFAEKNHLDSLQVIAYYDRGRAYAVSGNLPEGISNLQKAHSLINEDTPLGLQGRIIGMMGYSYYNSELYDTAIDYYKESIEIFKEIHEDRSMAIALSTIGSIYFQTGDIESAGSNYREALQITEAISDSLLMSTNLTNLGLVYRKMGDLDSSLVYAKRALAIAERFNDVQRMTDLTGDVAGAYLELGNMTEALAYAENSLGLSLEHGSNIQIRDAYEVISEVQKRRGDGEDALQNYILFKAYSDSVISDESQKQMVEARERFEAEKREQEIALLEAEKNEERLKAWMAILIAIALVAVVSIIYWQTSKRRAKEKELKLKSVQSELENLGVLIAEKDAFMTSVTDKLRQMGMDLKSFEAKKEMNSLIDSLHQNIKLIDDEDQLIQRIEQVNNGFFQELESKFGNLTKSEKRLASLVKMELSNKEMSSILGINPRSVVQAKFRLKKKLDLGPEDDLDQYLKSMN